jgi:uncharacterized membrane protein
MSTARKCNELAVRRAFARLARELHYGDVSLRLREDHESMSIERSTVEGDRTLALVAYVLHLVGAVAGVTSIVGLVINYVKRDRYDELFDTHHAWMIRSFWWTLLWYVIGFVTIVIFIGWAILFLAWIWYIYRHVRGLVALVNGEPMPR